MSTSTRADVIGMYDIESLDTGPRSIVLQIGWQFVPADDPETILDRRLVYIPIDPQILLNRTFSGQTLAWWMDQPDEVRARFKNSIGDDFQELPALMRFVARKFQEVTDGKSYELWARGPQFDFVNIESLMQDCAVKVPWKYDRIRDLRTLMKIAGVASEDVQKPHDLVPHVADQDARFQILCWDAATRALAKGA